MRRLVSLRSSSSLVMRSSRSQLAPQLAPWRPPAADPSLAARLLSSRPACVPPVSISALARRLPLWLFHRHLSWSHSRGSSRVRQPLVVVPAWLLRAPLLGRAMAHLAQRPTWPGHGAFVLSGLSFLLTDMLWLRAIASASCALAIAFNYFHPVGRVLWLPIYWNVTYVLVNLAFIGQIINERYVRLSDEHRVIYNAHFLRAMPEADFRRLANLGAIEHVPADGERRQLLQRGQKPTRLYVIYEGKPIVTLDDGVTIVRDTGLVGEMSYLKDTPAVASVHVEPNSRYLVWERSALDRALERDPALRCGLELAIARELMSKVITSNKALVIASRAQAKLQVTPAADAGAGGAGGAPLAAVQLPDVLPGLAAAS